jgi:hypothetical protein
MLKERALLIAGVMVLAGLELTIVVWQIVGIWRAALKHIARGGERLWAGAALVACILVAMSAIALSYMLARASHYGIG